jgi:hypothetical protein
VSVFYFDGINPRFPSWKNKSFRSLRHSSTTMYCDIWSDCFLWGVRDWRSRRVKKSTVRDPPWQRWNGFAITSSAVTSTTAERIARVLTQKRVHNLVRKSSAVSAQLPQTRYTVVFNTTCWEKTNESLKRNLMQLEMRKPSVRVPTWFSVFWTLIEKKKKEQTSSAKITVTTAVFDQHELLDDRRCLQTIQ